jgi:anti-sigma B factor antagonist
MDVFPTRRDEHMHVISVRGDVDLATAGDLLLRLRILAGPASGPLLLDLSQTTFMDGAGLRALRAFDQYVAAAGGSVHVAAASLPVARLFELVGLLEDAAQVPASPEPGTLPAPTAHERRPEAWAIAGT